MTGCGDDAVNVDDVGVSVEDDVGADDSDTVTASQDDVSAPEVEGDVLEAASDAADVEDSGPDEPEDTLTEHADADDVAAPSDTLIDVEGPEDTNEGEQQDDSDVGAGDEEDAETASGPDSEDDVVPAGCVSDEECVSAHSCETGSCDLTTGICVFSAKADGTPCDDGTLCSEADTCQAGVCLGGVALECDDGNPCTDDICDPNTGCVYAFNFGGCDDGNPCTANDLCVGGVCSGNAAACDDGNPCTLDQCVPSSGECIFTPDDTLPCSDGSQCTGGDRCEGGACIPGECDACDDANDCTVDSCDEGICKNFPLEDEPCDDGEVCTSGDICLLAVCVPGQPDDCDDGNACTVDSCVFGQGCTHEITPDVTCDDGDVCTGGGLCDTSGECVPATFLDCDDANPCTVDDCHPENGCVHAVKGGQCDDGNPCTAGDFCLGGQCKGQPATCTDNDACTYDSCDEVLGCQFADISASCSDDDVCTDDSCDPESGCVFTPNAASCDDGLLCTDEDTCSDGVCVGQALDCTDDDACTAETCDPEEGCVSVVTPGVACDDALVCTTDTTCDAEGVCAGGEATPVDDAIACTFDACTEGEGVVHLPDDSLCDGGRYCDASAGCIYSSGALMVTKFAWTQDDGLVWLALLNTSDAAIDLNGMSIGDDQGQTAALFPLNAEASMMLEPGARVAAIKAPALLPDPATDGFSLTIGSPELPPPAFIAAGGVLSVFDDEGVVLDSLEIASVVSEGEVGPNDFPMHDGFATEFDATASALADADEDNDPEGLWCSWPAGAQAPEGAQIACSRVRLNEIALAEGDGARFIELHMPAGGSLAGIVLRVIGADGALLTQSEPLSGRTPMSTLVTLSDGVGGVSLPEISAGSVQLIRSGTLVDVCGFGALDVTQDQTFNLAMVEGEPAAALSASQSLSRVVDGEDSEDNLTDWVLTTPTPASSND